MLNYFSAFNSILRGFFTDVKYALCWRDCLTSEELEQIESIRTDSNINRMLLCILILIIFETANIIANLVSHLHPLYGWGYLVSAVYLSLVSLVYFFIILYMFSKQETSLKSKKFLYRSFWVLIAIGILFFNTFDIIERGSLINFVLFLFAVTLIPILDIKELSTLFLSAIIYQFVIMHVVGAKPILFLQSLMFMFATLLIAQALLISFVRSCVTQKKLEFISETDALTGLLNRRGLEKRLKQFRKKCHYKNFRVALAILDIDYFKICNDIYGHLEGDKCLKVIADCMKSSFRDKKNIICRYGGEEFLIIFQDSKDSEVLESLLLLKRHVNESKIAAGNTSVSEYVTVSIGVSIVTTNIGTNYDDLLLSADSQLYNAKQNGRNIISLDGKLYS